MSLTTPSIRTFRGLLNNTFAISRPALTSDGMGGSTRTHTSVATVAGHVQPGVPEEMAAAQRLNVEFSHVLFIEAGSGIARGDRVTGAGGPYRVVDIVEPSYAQFHHEIRLLREIP